LLREADPATIASASELKKEDPIMHKLPISLLFLAMTGCSGGALSHLQNDQRQRDYAFHEMRTELGDLRHALQACHTELQILGDRLSEQETTAKQAQLNKSDISSGVVAACEKRLANTEKTLEKMANELHSLTTHADQTSQSLASFKEKLVVCQNELAAHKQKIEGVTQLKATIGQISQVMNEQTASNTATFSYRVKSGDTLEKIAKKHGLTLANLKRMNDISQDKILVGQELKVTGSSE
jgi:LysM repeat protein